MSTTEFQFRASEILMDAVFEALEKPMPRQYSPPAWRDRAPAERAKHLFAVNPWRAADWCQQEGISEADIEAGARAAEDEAAARLIARRME